MKNLTIPGVTLALILAAAPVTLVYADEPAPDSPATDTATEATEAAETTEAKSIQWVETWAAGRAVAEESGKLMLVYVHRNSPP